MKTLSYGISDFSRLIRKNYYYVDKTRYIELDRAQPPYLFLIRPHRFGKSLFIAMLETYYSIDYIEELMGLWHLLFLFCCLYFLNQRTSVMRAPSCGISNFSLLMRKNYYYVNKTRFIGVLKHQSTIREFIDGEAHIKGFLLAYLGLTQGYVILPEHESSKGYADFYMMPDLLHQSDIAYSYIVEVKYARRDASDVDIALLKRDAAEQLRRYATDEKVLRTKGNTRLELITLVFKGWELVVLEKL